MKPIKQAQLIMSEISGRRNTSFVCKICNKTFKRLSGSHLKKHELTYNQYFEKFFPVRRCDGEFAYLVGFWMGDGIRSEKRNLWFSNRFIYIAPLIDKIKHVMEFDDIDYRYYEESYSLCLYDCAALRSAIGYELAYPKTILKFPWHFLCGFLDSDGWVGLPDPSGLHGDSRAVNIHFTNTNPEFLGLTSQVTNMLNIPTRLDNTNAKLGEILEIAGTKTKVNKEQFDLSIRTNAANYVAAKKMKGITIDATKQQRMEEFVNYYEDLHLEQTIPICLAEDKEHLECFIGIQGEGINIGRSTYFIRGWGCNLHCKNCDTQYSWHREKYSKKNDYFHETSLKELVDNAIASRRANITLTGGEILQYTYKVQALIAFLRVNDLDVILQTNGTKYDRAAFSLSTTVAMDIKSPSMGAESNPELIFLLRPQDEVKTLIGSDEDFEFAKSINRLVKEVGCNHVLQVFRKPSEENLNDISAKYRWLIDKVRDSNFQWYNIRILPQLHVFLFGPNSRGK